MSGYLAAALVYLATLDGPIFAAAFLGLIAFLLVLPGLVVRLGGTERRESLSERHDRLDAEAATAPDLAANVAAFDSMPKEMQR